VSPQSTVYTVGGKVSPTSFPIIGGRVGAAVDLLRGHIAVRYGEHAFLLQHLHRPEWRPAAVWWQ